VYEISHCNDIVGVLSTVPACTDAYNVHCAFACDRAPIDAYGAIEKGLIGLLDLRNLKRRLNTLANL
jgi:hypothetical protein